MCKKRVSRAGTSNPRVSIGCNYLSLPLIPAPVTQFLTCIILAPWSVVHEHIEGILPKGPYLPCVSMAGRALLAGYPQYTRLINELHLIDPALSFKMATIDLQRSRDNLSVKYIKGLALGWQLVCHCSRPDGPGFKSAPVAIDLACRHGTPTAIKPHPTWHNLHIHALKLKLITSKGIQHERSIVHYHPDISLGSLKASSQWHNWQPFITTQQMRASCQYISWCPNVWILAHTPLNWLAWI